MHAAMVHMQKALHNMYGMHADVHVQCTHGFDSRRLPRRVLFQQVF